MNKHIRNALAALAVAFALAFSLGPLGDVFGMNSTPSAYAAGGVIKP